MAEAAKVQYKLVCANSAADLEAQVRALLGGGWRPQGGVAFAIGIEWQRFAQAMVKEAAA